MTYSAGIDLGGTSTKVGLVSADGRILAEDRTPAIPGEPLPELFNRLRLNIAQMARAAHLPYPPPGGAGVGAAAIVDHRTGWLKLAGALKLENCDLRGAAEAALECHVAVDCDSNAGALADLYWGQARSAVNVLYITWGTGLGAGLIVKRRLYHTVGGSMGEFGHTPVEWDNPRQCYCGCRGCLETEAAGRAMERRMGEKLGRPITVREMARLAAAGDVSCRAALERSARLLARGLAGVLALLNPDCLVLGGGVSHCLKLVRPAFDDELEAHLPWFTRQGLTVALSCFPDTAGVIGSAMLPLHQSEEGI
ncbi:MAG: ROK family protein [Bryobacteraceae bacterium]|nr:ROK family protein [Bryobacteraceae bacterium]